LTAITAQQGVQPTSDHLQFCVALPLEKIEIGQVSNFNQQQLFKKSFNVDFTQTEGRA